MSAMDMSPPKPSVSHDGALLLSAVAALLWGTNFEATRIVLEDLPPWTAASGRFVVASAVIVAWLAATRGLRPGVLARNAPAFAALGVIGVAGFNAALFLGLRTSSPITAALIMGTTPLTTNLLDSLLHGRAPRAMAVVGMAVSLLGVALTVGALSGTRFAEGDLMILAGSLAWAVYTIGCRSWVRDATPFETAAWTMLFGAVALTAVALAVENPGLAISRSSPAGLVAVLYMALIGSVLAYLFWQVGVAVRGAAATAILFNLVPVAALCVAAGFGRLPAVSQVAGVAVAVIGVLLASGRLTVRGRSRRTS